MSGLATLGSVVAYLVAPQRLRRASLPLPGWLRWLGAGIGLAAVSLLAWVHRSLGRNFAPDVRIREGQVLVTGGPYRRVRHPLYTVFYLFALALFLVSANWGVGLAWLAGLTLVIGPRVRREEAAMTARFGNDYRTYMRRTGRFLPRFSRRTNPVEGGYR